MIFRSCYFLFVFSIFNVFCAIYDRDVNSLSRPPCSALATHPKALRDDPRAKEALSLEDLTAHLQGSGSLVELALNNCNLKASEIVLVSSFLQKSTVMRSLDLSRNTIAEEGAHALGRALATNDSLKRLDVSFNDGDSSDLLRAVGLGLKTKPTPLDFLSLEGNLFGNIFQKDLDLLFSTRIGFLDLSSPSILISSITNSLTSNKGKGALSGLKIPERDVCHKKLYKAAREYNVILYMPDGPWTLYPYKTKKGQLMSLISGSGQNPLLLVAPTVFCEAPTAPGEEGSALKDIFDRFASEHHRKKP